jgi:neutral ceramidase
MGDTGTRRSIVSALSAKYPGVYNDNNIAIASTHSHAGVGGYLENLLPQITALGYVKQTADAIVTGTVLAVQRAHDSLAPGSLAIGNTTVLNGNINRSPFAYLANPASERARYQYDQDKDMSLLRFNDANGNARGFISFFPVHGTSLYMARAFSVDRDVNKLVPLRIIPSSAVITREWRLTFTKVGAHTFYSFIGLSVN